MSASPGFWPSRADDDRLDPIAIENETPQAAWGRLSVIAFSEIGSTNDEAIKRVGEGAPTGLLVIAEHQTAGRGRRGRCWKSTPGSGLCFSLVVHPTSPRQHWPLLSLLTSVAVARSLEQLPLPGNTADRLRVDLKWPNDVLLSGKKVAGILIETSDSPGGSYAAVIGVGINVAVGSVPAGMEHTATSINREAGASVARRALLVAFLDHFQQEYLLFERGDRRELLEHWKARSSMWNGTRVLVCDGDVCREATTCGLSDSGAIRVRFSDGTEDALLASDVSIRDNDGTCRGVEQG